VAGRLIINELGITYSLTTEPFDCTEDSMKRTIHYAAAGLGTRPSEAFTPSKNHYASDSKLSKEASAMVAEMGLQRVAGNVFECPSTQEFWKVGDKGSLVRLTSGEVDNGDRIAPAPKESAQTADFLQGILAELEF
jgi:hypothetical protein